eukprot:gene19136-biopygen17476
MSPGGTGQWRGHGAGVARAIGYLLAWGGAGVARAWRGRGAGFWVFVGLGWRGRGAGYRQFFGLGWRGRGTGISCSPWLASAGGTALQRLLQSGLSSTGGPRPFAVHAPRCSWSGHFESPGQGAVGSAP